MEVIKSILVVDLNPGNMDANLEATCNALYEMACDVNDALYYQYHASMEEQ